MSGQIYNIQWFDFARDKKILVGLKRGLIATYHTANWCKILISSDQGFTMFEGDKFNQEMREDLVDEFGFVACRSQWLLGFVFVHFTYFLLSTQSRKIATLLPRKTNLANFCRSTGAARGFFFSNLKWKSKRHWAATVMGRKESYLQ
jgi:hypothetical protein